MFVMSVEAEVVVVALLFVCFGVKPLAVGVKPLAVRLAVANSTAIATGGVVMLICFIVKVGVDIVNQSLARRM